MAGVIVATPQVHSDDRGLLVETFRREWLPAGAGEMVQANRADRRAGTVVGLHYHLRQADYWYAPAGTARAVLHDLRTGSPTDGVTMTVALGDSAHRGVYIPAGVAHGFAALTDVTLTYLVDRYYDPADELGVAWDDPDVAADWGVAQPVLSERDRANPARRDLAAGLRPDYRAAVAAG
ncbi:MAG TPA: dTDP-4-dehydrorhamnose 3,5-epimerase [Acidimicrobiaceae bacterium]|nr:dTDP-4-dehydrorhamnose 3,5-epimerase [Acidimicrobiaceae bacterium]HCB37947.1 dTDP-4-dehydrorhamnose 3,5-epimerase [Acidimicrobiaceae bacterium]